VRAPGVGGPGCPVFCLEVREPTPEELAQLGTAAGTLPPEWLAWADEAHRVLVGAESGRVVAAVHLAVVGRGEGWIEGVRAVGGEDADAQDRLVDGALRMLDGYGVVVVRTAWPSGGRPEWLDRAGFGERAHYVVHLAPEDLRPGRVQPVAPRQAGSAWSRLTTVLRRHAGELLPLGWRWRAFTPEMALGAARTGWWLPSAQKSLRPWWARYGRWARAGGWCAFCPRRQRRQRPSGAGPCTPGVPGVWWCTS